MKISYLFIIGLVVLLTCCKLQSKYDEFPLIKDTFDLYWADSTLKFQCKLFSKYEEYYYFDKTGNKIDWNTFFNLYGKKEMVSIEKAIFNFKKERINLYTLKEEYKTLIDKADQFMISKNYKAAYDAYKKAHRFFRKERYPKRQMIEAKNSLDMKNRQ